jgi:hypothetical protein
MRKFLLILGAISVITSCDKVLADFQDIETPTEQQTGPTKKFTFTVKGNFTSDLKTKASEYLYADGKQMTDLWVLDYMDGTLVQQLHQVNTDDDFGKPVMQLAYGTHHIYFVASRGQSPILSTTDKTITFSKVLDTFWTDYEATVVATSNGNRAVTLDRVVTRLKLCFTDALVEGLATIHVTPGTWYYGLNYTTGEPVEAKNSTAVVMDVPSSMIGNANETVNVFGFSSSTEWTTDVAVAAKKSDLTVLGHASIEDVPFKRNRSTNYSGPLFITGGEVGITLSASWDDSATGTW